MEIIGIGIDICRNDRIKKLIEIHDEKFLIKVFHQSEINFCIERYGKIDGNFFAKRFAGKEAFVKALGIGFNEFIKKNEIIILNDLICKKPLLTTCGETKNYIEGKFVGNLEYFVSMSDEKEFSVANVLISRR